MPRLRRLRPESPAPGAALPTLYLRQIATQLQVAGVPIADWLSGCGVSAAILALDSPELPDAVFRTLIADALARSREPALGLLVGARLLPGSHGLVSLAVQSSTTLRETLVLIEHFISLRTTLVKTRVRPVGTQLRLELIEPRPLFGIRITVLEAVSLALKNLIDAVAMGKSPVRQVRLPFAARPYRDLTSDLFGCPVRYGATHAAICLDMTIVDQPLRTRDPIAHADIEAACQSELDRLRRAHGFAAQAAHLLLEQRGSFLSLPACARLLHMSQRSLHRRLEDEGTSWRSIVDDSRRTLAIHHLDSGQFTVEEVAGLLGYTETRNFRRAFCRWTGRPPGSRRRRP